MWHSTVSRWAAGAGSSCQDKLVTSYNTTTPSTLQWPPPTQWTNTTTPLLLCCGAVVVTSLGRRERGTVGSPVLWWFVIMCNMLPMLPCQMIIHKITAHLAGDSYHQWEQSETGVTMERPRHHHHHPGGGSDLQLHSLIHSVERDIQRLQQMEDNDTLKGIHIRAVKEISR